MKLKTDVVELMEDAKFEKSYLKVCAPMVRYSKVQFRRLVKNYNVNLSFTPMIMADSFCHSEKARQNEFATTTNDTPLIVQFAAKNNDEFVDASRLVYPYADGVDLNCGCPQRWALKDGYGCALLEQPDLIHSLVRNFKNNFPNKFSVSVKVRLIKDLKRSIQLCQNLEKCGVSFLTVHARTIAQKSSEPIDVDALKEINKSIQTPLIANGGIKTLDDANILYDQVHPVGIMAASSILTNPALFSGVNQTPVSCVQQWMDLKNQNDSRITFQCYHHHLVFMLEKTLNKHQKNIFNYLSTFESVDNFLKTNIISSSDIKTINNEEYINCNFPNAITEKYLKCAACNKIQINCLCKESYNSNITNGKFFDTYLSTESDLDFMDSNDFIRF